MKFLVDAQLPQTLSAFLRERGFDSLHTLDLPKKNKTTDSMLNDLSLEEKRILVTKDNDFIQSFFICNKPYQLLYLSTGNIKNSDLLQIFKNNINTIQNLFVTARYIEMTTDGLFVHC